jgi:hypothetical protein
MENRIKKLIEQFNESLKYNHEEYANKMLYISNNEEALDEVTRRLEESEYTNYYFWWSPVVSKLNWSIYALDSLKDMTEIASIFTKAFKQGFTHRHWNNDFLTMSLGNDVVGLELIISGTKAACLKVQIGTRTEEVPVYEIRCQEPQQAVDFQNDLKALQEDGDASK